jgi:hypothetical protein
VDFHNLSGTDLKRCYVSLKEAGEGATIYYSPRSMDPPFSLPKWDFNKLEEVTPVQNKIEA